MNILRVDFHELYRRHLCRHGQFGINLWHILAVYGIYFSICSLAAVAVRTLLPQATALDQSLVLAAMFLPYLAVLVRNIPVPVMLLTVLSAVILILAAVSTQSIPFWLHVIMIPVWHRVQLISHRRYILRRDMSAFDSRYRKGRTLFLLLAVYELPILLHYLAFGRKDWVR